MRTTRLFVAVCAVLGALCVALGGQTLVSVAPSLAITTHGSSAAPVIYTPDYRYAGIYFDINGPRIAGMLTLDANLRFPGTQVANGNANTLDDYEEGTWTPQMIANGGGTPTYATDGQIGRYVKIGKYVWAYWKVALSSKGTLSGDAGIVALPFAAANVTGLTQTMPVRWTNATSSYVQMGGYVLPGDTTINLVGLTAADTTSERSLAVAGLSNTTVLSGWVVYEAGQ